MSSRRRRRRLCLVLAAGIGLAACGGGGGSSFDVGLQKVALDLAFKDDSAPSPTPVPAGRALEPVGVESQGELTLALPRLEEGDTTPPPLVLRDACPKAPANAVQKDIVTRDIDSMVKPGRYIFRDNGEFEVTGPIPIRGKLPPFSVRDYRNPQTLPQPNDSFGGPVDDWHSWEVVQPFTGSDYIKREFRAEATALKLVRVTYKFGDAQIVFAPVPAITMMDLGAEGGEGETWESAGTDPATGASMVVQGEIERRELIDACGTVFEGYKIRNTERIVSIGGAVAFSSVTDDTTNEPFADGPGLPNRYWVANQYGGFFLQEETHTTTQISGTIISIDGTSTVSSLDPRPLPKS